MRNSTSHFSFLCFSFQLVELKIWHSCFPFTRVKMCGMWSKGENCNPLGAKTRRSVLRHQIHHLIRRWGREGGPGGAVVGVGTRWLCSRLIAKSTWSCRPHLFLLCGLSCFKRRWTWAGSRKRIVWSAANGSDRGLRQEWKILLDVNQYLGVTSDCGKSQEKGESSPRIWSVAW